MMGTQVPELTMFGPRVKRKRLERGWSLRDLAAKAGVSSASTINRVENGKGDIWLSAAVKIAAALEVSLDELLAPAACSACDGHPPPGFICAGCRREGERPAGPDGFRTTDPEFWRHQPTEFA